MIEKILLIMSIIFNTIGFTSVANGIDRKLVDSELKTTNSALAVDDSIPLPDIMPRVTVKRNAPDANILAKNYLLVHEESGIVLTQQGYKERVPIASTTKIMTSIVVLDNYNLEDTVAISSKAASQIGSSTNLRVGEKLKVSDLLKTLLISSCNTSAYALAEHLNSGSEEGIQKFVDLMNNKAKELGLKDTEYHDPAGLDTTGYSSAYDLYLTTKKAMEYPLFRQIVSTDLITVYNIDGTIRHDLTNSNRLVGEWKYPGAIGVKTGYMPEAGHCLVAAAKRNNITLISVVLNTTETGPTKSAEESRKLLNWGFDNLSIN